MPDLTVPSLNSVRLKVSSNPLCFSNKPPSSVRFCAEMPRINHLQHAIVAVDMNETLRMGASRRFPQG